MKRFIISMLTLVSITCVYAQSPIFEVDGIFYRLLEDTTATSPSGMIAAVTNMGVADSYEGEVSIPGSISRNGAEHPVTTITDMAFRGSKVLTSITIPASVTYVPDGAFYGCRSLTTITVAPGNPKYDSRDNCNAVIETATNTIIAGCNNTTIPSSAPNLGDCAFWGTKGKTSFSIDQDIKSIGLLTFLDCDDLETLYWNNPSIPITAITGYNRTKLKHVVLGDSVTIIPNYAFSGCSLLESIQIPSGLKNIDAHAFAGCNNLKNIELPSGLEFIGYYAFGDCNSLTSINIPANLWTIDYRAFQGCNNIETVYWNYWDSVAMSFIFKSSRESIRNIIIGDAVTSIEGKAFDGFTNLTSIKVDPDNKVYDSRDNCNAVVNTATNTLIAGCKSTTVPEGITRLESYAFKWCGGPESATLPSTLLSIGRYAFSGCNSLESITIPQNVNDIDIGIFYGCNNLTSIMVDPRNQYYNSRGNCNSIIDSRNDILVTGCKTSVIPSGVKGIASNAFEGCFELKNIDLPASIQSIGEAAFFDCSSLESLIIPEGVTDISGVFNNCYSLSYLSIPSTATFERISYHPFQGCPALETAGPRGGGYNLEFAWDTIPGCAFSGMVNLKSVYIPKSVKLINAQGVEFKYVDAYDYNGIIRGSYYVTDYFQGCQNLESIAISFSDTKIKRRVSPGTIYTFESPADYHIYLGTGIHSITILDDIVNSSEPFNVGHIDEINLSEYVKDIRPGVFEQAEFLSAINVLNGNPNYSSTEGVLFNKSGDELLAYPVARINPDYYVPNTVTRIADNAFVKTRKLQSVSVSKNVESIGTGAFKNCRNLESVIIKGKPEIGLNAFSGCPDITSVTSLSDHPVNMLVSSEPQAILVGSDEIIPYDNEVTKTFNSELGRNVSLIKGSSFDWTCRLSTTSVVAGKYRVRIGILPSPQGLPNNIHPIISTGNGNQLLNSLRSDTVIDAKGRKRIVISEVPYQNDISGYDLITIADTLVIPEGSGTIYIDIKSLVYEQTCEQYSSQLLLDAVLFEPLDEDIPEQRYAGPFTESVFNNATLFVPDGTVEAYRNADGWKLFRNIEVDDKTYPAEEIEVQITDAGYATFFYSDADYLLPDGLSALIVTDITPDGRLVYESLADIIESNTVPAGLAVILATDNGNGGLFKLQLAGRNYSNGFNNLLIGTDVDTLTYAPESSLFYKLSLGPSGSDLKDVPGWYWAAPDGGAFNIGAHKAWLAIPKSKNTRSSGFGLDGYPTGMIEVIADSSETETIMYDLYGRRLSAPVGHGLMIINGKKVYISE